MYFAVIDDNINIKYQAFNSPFEADMWLSSHDIYSKNTFYSTLTFGGFLDYLLMILGTHRNESSLKILKDFQQDLPIVIEQLQKTVLL